MRRSVQSFTRNAELLKHSLKTDLGTAAKEQRNRFSTQNNQPITHTHKPKQPSSSPSHHLYEPPIHIPTPEEAAAQRRSNAITAAFLLTAAGGAYYAAITRGSSSTSPNTVKPPVEENLVNWSGTHECHVKQFYQPESLQELELLVKQAHEAGQKLRCTGSGLSPNALSFDESGMVSLSLMDKILSMDKSTGIVKVQAGARVQEVADFLKKHGLTLQNYASIREQTIGGLTQVSAHGTGAAIPPIDDTVVGLKLVTPGKGTIQLTKDQDPELFHLARVGLGCLGVVAEVTLQCYPAHKLLEKTFVASLDQVKKNHNAWLKENQHLRYMWIPATDAIVVVMSNPVSSTSSSTSTTSSDKQEALNQAPEYSWDERLATFRTLLLSHSNNKMPEDEVKQLSPTQCRDALLALDPLNSSWVVKVNQAEADFWRKSTGERIGYSDEILGFDCGGQQWVLELAFPTGNIAQEGSSSNGRDIAYMEELQRLIHKKGIPAPAPIEQRWSSASASPMSPCYSADKNDLFSWVGIIMYLPEDEESLPQRAAITARFKEYAELVEDYLVPKYKATEHWAKIEIPLNDRNGKKLRKMRARLAEKYPLKQFDAARKELDPKNILGNDLVDSLLSPP